MKYAFVGAGAMGAVLGSYFFVGGQETWLIDPFQEHMNAIKNNGLSIRRVNTSDSSKNQELNLKINATVNAEDAGKVDVAFLMVKYDYTEAAVENLKKVSDENTTIITLQNGMGCLDILKKHFASEQLAYGCTTITGRILDMGVVETTESSGITVHLGSANKALSDKLMRVAEEFNLGGGAMAYEDNIDFYVWKKMCGNSGMNAWCGINRVHVKLGFSCPEFVELQRRTIEECLAVAQAKGVKIELADVLAYNKAYPVENSPLPAHYPSTCQDIMNKKKTDIECLNGYIVREGRRLNIPTPFNEALYLTVKTLEQTYDKQF